MGVRGLTSFIARHAELYMTPFELHDSCLVIDGDNLACNLYRDVTGSYSAFGGDYDDFYRGVKEFFRVLANCNVHPLVLMDGGYERRKLRTVDQRMRGKIAVIKRINPNGSIPVFPILMKEVFVDALRDSGVPVMRCVFEADDELAALGRRLNCPVLSYDSDFYIHNVQYIPLITLTVKAHLGYHKEGLVPDTPERGLRRAEVKSLEKRSKTQHILRDFKADSQKQLGNVGKLSSYRFLDCCMYRMENLIARGSLSKEKLPLFAALLGNDYIARSSFKNFFAVGLGRGGRSRKMQLQQKRIRLILLWLKGETAESALEKILTRLRKDQRESLKAQFYAATSGYSNELCHSYDFFNANYPEYVEKCVDLGKLKIEQEADIDDEEEDDDDDWVDEEEAEEEFDEFEENEENKYLENSNDEEEEGNLESKSNDDPDDEEEEEKKEEEEEEDYDEESDVKDKTKEFPQWFLQKLYPAHLSRFFVDLMHLRKYINSPQIEHFPYPDCHQVAIPILQYIFTLLHSVDGEIPKPRIDGNGQELPIRFSYMTRAQKITQVHYFRYEIQHTLPYTFDPYQPNPLFMQDVFNMNLKHLKTDAVFSRLDELPKDLQLYFLAIIYWMHISPHYDILHLHALLICLVVLRTVDSTIPQERDPKTFMKRFGKILKRERQVRVKEFSETGKARGIRADLLALSVPERMQHVAKSDCFLVQEQLLKHFHMQEIFKKKYDHFSTIVLHGFAEFQSVLFQLYALNALLDFPCKATKMSSCFCGVFLYNLYDLLRARVDIAYYVQHNIFRDSPLMFDFYTYLLNWILNFLPYWKKTVPEVTVSKKVLKKQRQIARRKAAKAEGSTKIVDPNADMLSESGEN